MITIDKIKAALIWQIYIFQLQASQIIILLLYCQYVCDICKIYYYFKCHKKFKYY